MESTFTAANFTAAELEPVLDRVFGTPLIFDGFERIRPRCWVRDTGLGFKKMFHLHAQKCGGSYVPYGAVSIDFVPRVKGDQVKLQTGPKHAVVHLSIDHGLKHWDWEILPSREGFTERLERIAGETTLRISKWLAAFNSIEDVVAAFEREKAKVHDFYCHPLQALAFAFSLARLGRRKDAANEFERAISNRYFSEELKPDLRFFFQNELNQHQPRKGGEDLLDLLS